MRGSDLHLDKHACTWTESKCGVEMCAALKTVTTLLRIDVTARLRSKGHSPWSTKHLSSFEESIEQLQGIISKDKLKPRPLWSNEERMVLAKLVSSTSAVVWYFVFLLTYFLIPGLQITLAVAILEKAISSEADANV